MADVARTYNVDATTIGILTASSPFEQSAGALQWSVAARFWSPVWQEQSVRHSLPSSARRKNTAWVSQMARGC